MSTIPTLVAAPNTNSPRFNAAQRDIVVAWGSGMFQHITGKEAREFFLGQPGDHGYVARTVNDLKFHLYRLGKHQELATFMRELEAAATPAPKTPRTETAPKAKDKGRRKAGPRQAAAPTPAEAPAEKAPRLSLKDAIEKAREGGDSEELVRLLGKRLAILDRVLSKDGIENGEELQAEKAELEAEIDSLSPAPPTPTTSDAPAVA